MTSESSSPCWALPDPFSAESIRARLPEPHHSWRRALPGASDLHNVRAKSIRLGEIATPTQSRESNRNSNLVSIYGENGDRLSGAQPPKTVQWNCAYLPDKTEQLLLTQIERLGRATPSDLAPLIKRSVTWTTKRLAKLAAKQLVVGRPGRNGGYELVGGGQ